MEEEFILFAEQDILERVDEYSLYCFYLEVDVLIGGKVQSPIRSASNQQEDYDPSFSVFEKRWGTGSHEFIWKDLATGAAGDIFELVRRLFRYETRMQAKMRIMADFGIGGISDGKQRVFVKKERLYNDFEVNIQISSRPYTKRDYNFWKQFNITDNLLSRYNTTAIRHYWITEDQKTPSYPKGLGYAYRIYDKYQLYFPHVTNKKHKFRHNYTEVCVPGFAQLDRTGELCIITKSMKDVMCLRSFGYEAIGARSENTVLPEVCLEWLKSHYKKVLVLFDNDMKHKGDAYEFEKIYVPQIVKGDKDTSDFCKNHGPSECADMLRQITRR